MAIRLVISLLLFVGNSTSFALQTRDVVDGQTVLVQVSAKEPSRVVVAGQPIRAATAAEDLLTIHRDEKDPQGHVYVKPNDPARHATLFLSTDTGAYSLLLQPADIPAETIVLRDKSQRATPKLEQSATRIRAAKSLMLAMSRGAMPDGMEVREVGQDYALWREARFTLIRVWMGQSFVGERWNLANLSADRMTVLEQEFFRDGVVAVAVPQLHIEPGQGVAVFVVRERKDDE